MAHQAAESLRRLDPRLTSAFLATEAGERELEYFARHSPSAMVVEAILRRRDTPRPLLAELAPHLAPDLQEILVHRQDAIVEAPEILTALEANPQLSLYVRRRISEYREHLLPRAPSVPAAVPEVAPEALSAEELAELERARAAPRSGEHDEETNLSEGQIRMLPVPLRMKLTRGASRTLRGILVRDLSSTVALAVLANSALAEEEVEQVAASRQVVDEVLVAIARRREWTSKYGIINALVHNPRTPVGISVRFVPRLSIRDLKYLSRNRNVPDAVRSTAARLYRIKIH